MFLCRLGTVTMEIIKYLIAGFNWICNIDHDHDLVLTRCSATIVSPTSPPCSMS